MLKKSVSAILSLMIILGAVLAVSVNAVSKTSGTYFVAGDFLEPIWTENANPMTQNNYEFEENIYDYSLTVPNVPAGKWGFKVTDGTWENCWGTEDGNNYMFTLNDTCNVTIYFNSVTKAIAVKAKSLDEFELEYITAVGSGKAGWLNGSDWNLNDQSNIMTEIESDRYEITYTNVPASNHHQFKFACNGEWDYNWGASSNDVLTGNNINLMGVIDPIYNITFEVIEDNSTVTLKINVSEFNFTSKQGEVPIEIIITPPETEPPTTEPPTTEPPTTEPPTTEPSTNEPTTAEPTTTEPPITDSTDPPATDYTNPSKLLGDADGDGEVNVKDATYIQLYLANLLGDNYIDLTVCDIDSDGDINVKDVTYIQLQIANLL
ncbi:MAG: hypothetical protein J1E56_07000 [Ruminococcus sp.]|nr:hypothetical protein [Ruminococcus sp.]